MTSKVSAPPINGSTIVAMLVAFIAAIAIFTLLGNSVFSSSVGGNTEELKIKEDVTIGLGVADTDTLGITDSVVVEVTRAQK